MGAPASGRPRRGKRKAEELLHHVMVRSSSSGSDFESDLSYPNRDLSQSPTSPGSLEHGRRTGKRIRQLPNEYQKQELEELLRQVGHLPHSTLILVFILMILQTKFPSTQAREEIGRRIGMEPRRVQVSPTSPRVNDWLAYSGHFRYGSK